MREFGWKQMHMERLQYLYGEDYRRWLGKHRDDRALYCRLYEAIEAGLRSLPTEPNAYIKAAVSEQIKRDRETMDKIVKIFQRREKMYAEAAALAAEGGAVKEAAQA